ncbi:MAG TPA: 50S ribosomal protein L25 [Thermotogota bacterium]|nr:50S ribosomal protein L25 [Thermotogota bacterium]HRW91865.1 50S ribosomal protein L25 [Thermotogota bacterium]
MQNIKIEAQERSRSKTSGARKIRRDALLPGVVYGPDFQPVSVQIDRRNFEALSHHISSTTAIALNIQKQDGSSLEKRTYLKSVQRHKVHDHPVHLDFYVPSAGHKMRIEVPIEYLNKPQGVEKGGILEFMYESILIEALPKDIPEKIQIDIAGIDLGESLKLQDVDLPEGIKALMHADDILLTVLEPRGAAAEEGEEAEEEGEEMAQPEVIKEKKEED